MVISASELQVTFVESPIPFLSGAAFEIFVFVSEIFSLFNHPLWKTEGIHHIQ